MRLSPFPLALAMAAALSACTGAPVREAAPPAAVPPAASGTAASADDNLNAVLWVQRSAEYRAAAAQAYRAAALQLDAALAASDWNALVPEERAAAARRLPPAVVVDVDETVLDNSPYQARLVAEGAEYNETTWDAWVRERKARAVPGVVEFARAAQARGITMVYVTNRAQHLAEPTIANLRAVGLPVAGPEVFLGLGTVVDGCEQEGSEKNCRRIDVGRRYRVLMQFGDQLGDFVHVQANTPAAREALLATHGAWFGSRWWMLPNPTYGSWEPALFGNNWRQPRDARRAAKRAALETAR